MASLYGDLEVVKLLLEKGANIDTVNNRGRTPLYWASRNGHLEVVKLLEKAKRQLTQKYQESRKKIQESRKQRETRKAEGKKKKKKKSRYH